MSDPKGYQTKYLKVDLASNKQNFVIKRFGTSRQKSVDKQVVKTRMIPHFPIRMGSTVNTSDSDEGSKTDAICHLDVKSNDDQASYLLSNEVQSKSRRNTTDRSDSTNNSSVLSKKANLLEARHLGFKVSMP
jgi:hypothetical protein